MYEAYRVMKRFGWKGWELAPAKCTCDCRSKGGACTGTVGSDCPCSGTVCRCACGIDPAHYGGDIWIVESGHPRKDIMLMNRFCIGDASIPPVEELLAQDQYKRLLSPPSAEVMQGRPRGRPRKEPITNKR